MKNADWTNHWASMEGAWAPWRTCTPITGYFHDKTKISKENLRVDYYLPEVESRTTRLEAKDTKKIRGQGQGQPFRGQTLSRPRTGMLEAKAKDQGHKPKCSLKKKEKKKVFTKIFQAISKKNKVFTKIFLAISTKQRFPKKFLSASQNFNNSKK